MTHPVEQQFIALNFLHKLKDPCRKDLESILHGDELFYLPPPGSEDRDKWIEVSNILFMYLKRNITNICFHSIIITRFEI